MIEQFWNHYLESPDAALNNSYFICWDFIEDIQLMTSIGFFFFTLHTKCKQIRYHVYHDNHWTMYDSNHTTQMPKDMKKCADAV